MCQKNKFRIPDNFQQCLSGKQSQNQKPDRKKVRNGRVNLWQKEFRQSIKYLQTYAQMQNCK